MNKKIIVRISNELGNQLFMYASSYAMAKKLNRLLFVDNETAYLSMKNISKYGLNNFKISSDVANNKNKYLGIIGYLKRKILKKINLFIKKKIFYIEPKDKEKRTKFTGEIYNLNLSDSVYLEGYFETEKYFGEIKDIIKQEFTFLDSHNYKKSIFFDKLNEKDSVSVCLRQNRFIEGRNRNNEKNILKSNQFRDEQINYINRSIEYLKKKTQNPHFYIWSNDLENLDILRFSTKVTKVLHKAEDFLNVDKRALDLFLISNCNHHIVIPSSFNWWGAWLSKKNDKIICRPSNNFFSDFKVNNNDFWPKNWIEINEKS